MTRLTRALQRVIVTPEGRGCHGLKRELVVTLTPEGDLHVRELGRRRGPQARTNAARLILTQYGVLGL